MTTDATVIPITRGTTESRTSRELRQLLHNAHARLDGRPDRYPRQRDLDRSVVLTHPQFQRSPLRTSIFGWQL